MAKKKTVQQLIKQLQPIFNKYIRLRDEGKPCISCGEYKTLQAGHFVAVSSCSGLRFDEDNVHGECAGCNCFNESHLIKYQENLIKKIGETDYYMLLELWDHYRRKPKKWTRDELEEMITEYKQKIKDYENN